MVILLKKQNKVGPLNWHTCCVLRLMYMQSEFHLVEIENKTGKTPMNLPTNGKNYELSLANHKLVILKDFFSSSIKEKRSTIRWN